MKQVTEKQAPAPTVELTEMDLEVVAAGKDNIINVSRGFGGRR
jgi:hypothetical protein